MNYCPICKADFIAKTIDDFERLLCSSDDCDFVHWNNPTPVVAAVVEHNGEIILAWAGLPNNISKNCIINNFRTVGFHMQSCPRRFSCTSANFSR